MPVYNVEKYVIASIHSVLRQSFTSFELIIINDGSTDNSLAICQSFKDSRIRIVSQKNRGLAGARNTGIRESNGEYVAFIDSDDLWHKNKLQKHIDHLDCNPKVGVSYSSSALIDENNRAIGIYQRPKLNNIRFKNIICRNPIGNGSAPVIRRSILDETSYWVFRNGTKERGYFDETFRQSEDIEYWLRIALKTNTLFEGLEEELTFYRVNSSGLSSNINRQYLSWERAISKAALLNPMKVGKWSRLAKAYQLRYLARHAVKAHQHEQALKLSWDAILTDFQLITEEPSKTITTFLSALSLSILPKKLFRLIENIAYRLIHLRNPRNANV